MTPPKEPGIYEVLGAPNRFNRYARWTGEEWLACDETPELAAVAKYRSHTMYLPTTFYREIQK